MVTFIEYIIYILTTLAYAMDKPPKAYSDGNPKLFSLLDQKNLSIDIKVSKSYITRTRTCNHENRANLLLKELLITMSSACR